jgi:HEAT repeat protein
LAAEALGKIGNEKALSALMGALATDTDLETVVNALAKIDSDWATRDCATAFASRYIEALSSENAQIRESAATALGMVCDERAVLPLADLLNDSAYRVRQAAARSLGSTGNTQARDLLIETMTSLPHDDLIVRTAVAEALANIGDTRAYEHLIASLDHTNPMVRVAAAEALGTLGDDRPVPKLIEALRDEDVFVRGAAMNSLQRLTGKDFANCKKWGRWLQKRERQ